MSKSFKIITLGCKVNQYESAYMKEALLKAGWVRAGRGETSGVSVINTCIVTQKAAHQSRQEIRKAIRENPEGMTAAVGCYAQVYPGELSGISGIGLIAGNTLKGRVPDLLLNSVDSGRKNCVLKEFEAKMPFEFLAIKRFPGRARAYLKIQDGCQSSCTYCIVPSARGPYRSLPLKKVLSMAGSLAAEGHKEIVLTGIHLGKYGVDLEGGMNFTSMLRALGKEKFPVRIRLSSIEPNEINEELFEMVASEEWLCRHFHIPLQSGDDRILRKMKRNYTAKGFGRLIEAIHKAGPMLAIGIDVMSGFPGEDIAAHENTRSLIKELPVSYVHVFPFSSRPGTAAAAFDGQCDPKLVKKRAAELRDLGQTKRTAFYKSCLKKEFPILAEGRHSEEKETMKGTSDNYLPVLFGSSRDCTGELISVHMDGVRGEVVVGSVYD
ncbi:MAG: tRNA (N(6)-L-threonylcarbamoyladenosine(37)-C(2))-methylthiotransferase MtaB [Desulfobacterales bacterium]|nr:tRNA (N(6)-L-threonylcarbamoyladenosine(37)-C(2))-methylthiotransferase MtaB [Desulfobacterales bacterium]